MAKQLPEIVSVAIAHAEAAGWPVAARNGKVVISAPDGTALTIGVNPNDESMKVWRSTIRRYNLEDGPAMTPKQQEEMAMATATQPKSASTNAAAAKKAAEATEANKKAALAASGKGPVPAPPKSNSVPVPVVTFTAPDAPVVTPKVLATKAPQGPKTDEDGFPPFDPAMLAIDLGDYPPFLIMSGKFKGKYFCGACWERGDKETFKAPQGLASHRGFRHGAYTYAANSATGKMPVAIETALELLRGVLIEEMTDTADAEQVRTLEEKVSELKVQLKERDLMLKEQGAKFSERGTMLTDIENTLRKVTKERDEAVKTSAERGTALDQAKAEYEAQVRMLLSRVEKDLSQMQAWANELAPVKAVGQILTVVEKYLIK